MQKIRTPGEELSEGIKIPLEGAAAWACRIPTETPESDGTLKWDATDLIVAELHAGGLTGTGFTYAHAVVAPLIRDVFFPLLLDQDAMNIPALHGRMRQAARNIGLPGLAMMAISAVDIALWDLKAKIVKVPLAEFFGAVRASIPVYGSGGFTSYSEAELRQQLSDWVRQGITRVKMKVGRNPGEDIDRVRVARESIGAEAELFVDANGAYSRKQALYFADRFKILGVNWFEEPVSSEDPEGLALLCRKVPDGMEIAAGEYGSRLGDFRHLLDAQAVDVLQADLTRCGGYTGFFQACSLTDAYQIPLSAHTAPSLHAPVACALSNVRHIEYFFDHVRIEQMLFDGFLPPENGMLYPNTQGSGLGLEFKKPDAARYCIDGVL